MTNITPEIACRNAEIVRRRQSGEWPFQIAEAMGLSRMAVIGVCNRAGLCASDTDRGAAMREKVLPRSAQEAIRKRHRTHSRTDGACALAREYGVHHATIRRVVRS